MLIPRPRTAGWHVWPSSACVLGLGLATSKAFGLRPWPTRPPAPPEPGTSPWNQPSRPSRRSPSARRLRSRSARVRAHPACVRESREENPQLELRERDDGHRETPRTRAVEHPRGELSVSGGGALVERQRAPGCSAQPSGGPAAAHGLPPARSAGPPRNARGTSPPRRTAHRALPANRRRSLQPHGCGGGPGPPPHDGQADYACISTSLFVSTCVAPIAQPSGLNVPPPGHVDSNAAWSFSPWPFSYSEIACLPSVSLNAPSENP